MDGLKVMIGKMSGGAFAVLALTLGAVAGPLVLEEDAETGGLVSVKIEGDETSMNWIRRADGKAFAWIGPNCRWGTGTLKVNGVPQAWNRVAEARPGGCAVYRPVAGLEIVRTRLATDDGYEERYVFRNASDRPLALTEIDIHTPFRDDYLPPKEMWTRRCHAHVWTGGSSAWVCALRMCGRAPHLGLVVTEGSVTAYGQKERGLHKNASNTRGVLTLSPPDVMLPPQGETAVAWLLFPHDGKTDFLAQVRKRGGVTVSVADWTVTAKEPVDLAFEVGDERLLSGASVRGEGVRVSSVRRDGRRLQVCATYEKDGEARVVLTYAGGRQTWAELLARGDPAALVKARAAFIARHQVYRGKTPDDPHDGALVEYDNETDRPYYRWEQPKETRLEVDHNEGAERVGMGVFLAMMARRGHAEYRPLVDRYRVFVRQGLQDADYTTWGEVDRASRRRLFNYPWVAEFHLEHYRVTGRRQSLLDACATLLKCYEKPVSYAFVESPECEVIVALREAGLAAEADRLLNAIKRHKDVILGVGSGVSKEVNYAPEGLAGRLTQLLGVAKLTGEAKYRDFALKEILPQFEACLGTQPSWHSHDIGLHHWDGYWFGKRKCWGDTLPHDWNGTAADVFRALAEATGDKAYRVRARAVVRQLLGLFDADGRAGCAWVLPDRVNGEPARFRDPLANDQDWSLVYYLRQCGD